MFVAPFVLFIPSVDDIMDIVIKHTIKWLICSGMTISLRQLIYL